MPFSFVFIDPLLLYFLLQFDESEIDKKTFERVSSRYFTDKMWSETVSFLTELWEQ